MRVANSHETSVYKENSSHCEIISVILDVPHVTYNAKIIFSEEKDRLALLQTLESHNVAWNECSKVRFGLKKNSIVEIHAGFYRNFRDKYPEIPAQIVIRAYNDVLGAYKSARTNKHKLSTPFVRKGLSMRLDKRSFSHKNGIFSIISHGPRVKCKIASFPKLEEFMGKFPFCDPLIFMKNGEVFMALTFKVPDVLPANNTVIGVDLGCRNIATTSDGKLIRDTKFNARKRSLRHLKDQLKSKASQGSKSAKRHLKKLRRKERNSNKNQTHLVANEILKTSASFIALENLKGLKKTRVANGYKPQNRTSQIPFFELRRVLTYKALLRGKQVITVDPRFTSQLDCRTGKKDGERIGARYTGKDKQCLHADVNAACNIAIRSKLPYSQGNLLEGQALVIVPNADSRESVNCQL